MFRTLPLCYVSPDMSRSMPDPTTNAFPDTRSSLIARVHDSADVEGWRIFHAQYARLVFHVCVKAGLRKEDAEDVSQEALAAVAKSMAEFVLDRSKGSFRSWLRQITAYKVADFLRKKYREGAVRLELPPEVFDERANEASITEAVWDEEWQSYILHKALELAAGNTSAKSMQIFHLITINGWSVEQIRETLRVSRTQVYLAKYRVGLLVKREIARLRKELE
jgi:RNA polymerase sigma factor (sigma-70 family)